MALVTQKNGKMQEFAVKPVKCVEFGVFSPLEIKSFSVARITNHDQHTVYETLNDPRLGLSTLSQRNERCITCHLVRDECPGHFGHIELCTPVYHIGYIRAVKKILECVCHHCFRFRLNRDDSKYHRIKKMNDPRKRFKAAWEASKTKTLCDFCDRPLFPLRRQGIELWQGGAPPYTPLPSNKSNNNGGDGGGVGGAEASNVEGTSTNANNDGDDDFVDIDGRRPKLGAAHFRVKGAAQVKKKTTTGVPLTAERARSILQNISDETVRLIGLNPETSRPENLILTVLPVPPPFVRPSIKMDLTSKGKGEDDLTTLLTTILKANLALEADKVARKNDVQIAALKEALQIAVTSYLDNDVAGMKVILQRSGGRKLRALAARWKGKEGRLRGNLMGKRVNFCARTVITGDATLSIAEVGVPQVIAQQLTFPESVTDWNLGVLQQLVDDSIAHHVDGIFPCAMYVRKKGLDKMFDLHFARRGLSLEVGDTVERCMVDGDIVLFNRQPSLHKMSMMAHRVRILPGKTFRLNVNVCSPYNADFDGDEMNLHFPQNLGARAELQVLAPVIQHIVSPQSNKPVIALTQDALCAIRKFTLRDCFLSREDAMQLLFVMEGGPPFDPPPKGATHEHYLSDSKYGSFLPPPAIMKPVPLWTGKQLISLTFPRGLYLKANNGKHADMEEAFQQRTADYTESETRYEESVFYGLTPDDTRVFILNGELVTGFLCKKTAGTAGGGIVHTIYNDFGAQTAADFIDNASFLLNAWFLMHGFSVGIGDALLSANMSKHIQRECIAPQLIAVDKIVNEYRNQTLKPEGNFSRVQTKENKITSLLAKARDTAGAADDDSSTRLQNNLKDMIEAGSKGTILNACQISRCVGQQIVEGKRIPFGFQDRTLPHFLRFDDSAAARGFVKNSFLQGVTPTEFFFHAMGGREGLIDTAVKTAETGYIQRRLVKALEDVSVRHDGTVRDSTNEIIQFQYGEDGLDGTAIEFQTFPTLMLSDDDFKAQFYNANAPAAEWELLQTDRDFLRRVLRLPEDRWPLPLNVWRVVVSIAASDKGAKALGAHIVFAKTWRLRQQLRPQSRKQSSDPTNEPCAPSRLLGILISSVLCTKHVTTKYQLSESQLDAVLEKIRSRYFRNLVAPGEAVGVLAAQSIGEPATQMTLNTFHLSGTGNKAVTSGIPRLKELINALKHIKTPGMTLYLNEPARSNRALAMKLRTQIEQTTLEKLVVAAEIIYDPDPMCSVVESDRPFLSLIRQVGDAGFLGETIDTASPLSIASSWILRLVFDRAALLYRDLSLTAIEKRLTTLFGYDAFSIVHSDNNSPDLVMILRLISDPESTELPTDMAEERFLRKFWATAKTSVIISGLAGVDKAFVSEKRSAVYGSKQSVREFIIETDGINLKDAVCLAAVDASRITCNDPQEMNALFGIEIARNVLLAEIRAVIEAGGSSINYRHLLLLVEMMTHRGGVMAITRHGINRTNVGPFKKASFEQTVEVLLDASLNGETDECRGVSANVALGKEMPLGTGSVQCLLDERALQEGGLQPPFDPPATNHNGSAMWLTRQRVVERLGRLDASDIDINITNDEPLENGVAGGTWNPLQPSYLM